MDQFEKSEINMIKSVAVYYSGEVMGKAKYRSVYRSTCYQRIAQKRFVRATVANHKLPRLVPYHKLMSFVKKIDTGKLYSVKETLCGGLPQQQKLNGFYRDLEELVVKMASFYLNSDDYKLHFFNNQNDTFHVSIGGDGAPFGKEDTATAWLVGFLNLGHGVLSCKENYLLFGANCSENCEPCRRFIAKTVNDICHIESSVYPIICKGITVNIKFVFSELPNDIQMLAFLAGELFNSASYFSTFVDVSNNTLVRVGGGRTFGTESSATWKAWPYDHCLRTACKVEQFEKTVEKETKCNDKTLLSPPSSKLQ
ncbi:uncharacterized protein LOC116614318 isoform X1 [Nematostella vectensis]|uniref:uncharacterized protein LOC116614318 isoform X1 n=1 Tax=Nematostella vectensis TaxID=45351 RepID=UPI0020770C08|nr:uncharacterized protein LOC116614318 isoform X1 [Nematostella vectensis]XP_048589527.1 uncharacterized protein LOC116614318 isoform X1 [Nematostella vectensis]